MQNKPKIIVIVGPTASGKSDLGVLISKRFNGEVISADSRQVYKGLDIGTGKIAQKEMKGISHHLLDVLQPRTKFTVHAFKKHGDKAIKKMLKNGKIPVIVGGTGFYIEALVDSVLLPEVKPDLKLRLKLSKKSAENLFKMLQKLDSKRSENIDPKNTHRLIRAIEIAQALGEVPAIKKDSNFNPLFIGLKVSPEELQERIAKRLKKRLKQGMISEARKLHKEGLSWKRMNELGLEYRYLALFLQNKISKEEMFQKLKTEIWRYAKRQMTWFKRDQRITWFKPTELKKIEKEVKTFLTQ